MMKCYFHETGLNRLPRNKEYWSLCNLQDPKEPQCEIEHLTQAGFIDHQQYHGVDRDKKVIEYNKKNYPMVDWHHGEWYATLCFTDLTRLGFVHLDTTYFANSSIAWKMAANTMTLCPSGTFIGINVIASAYAQKNLDTYFTNQLREYIGRENMKWSYIADFPYPGSKYTDMHTYMLQKK